MSRSPQRRALTVSLARRVAVPEAVAARMLHALPKVIQEALLDHACISIRGLGSWRLQRIEAARRLLTSNLPIDIDPAIEDRVKIRFTPSSVLESRISEELLTESFSEDAFLLLTAE